MSMKEITRRVPFCDICNKEITGRYEANLNIVNTMGDAFKLPHICADCFEDYNECDSCNHFSPDIIKGDDYTMWCPHCARKIADNIDKQLAELEKKLHE